MTRREKLEKLNDLLIDKAIKTLENEDVELKDLNPLITLLKNNKVVEENKQTNESDVIDELIEDISKWCIRSLYKLRTH